MTPQEIRDSIHNLDTVLLEGHAEAGKNTEAFGEFPIGEPKAPFFPEEQYEDEDTVYDSGVKYDTVKVVEHYQFMDGIEVRHVIQQAIKNNHLSGQEAHYYGNALKYLLRCGQKGKKAEDIHKAQQYLGFLDDELL